MKKTTLNTFLEDANTFVKDGQKVANKFKKEFASSFRSKEFEISVSAESSNKVKISVEINRFLDSSKESSKEFDQISKDLKDMAEKHSGALKVEEDGYFAGPVAVSIIKRGKTINADALLSTVEVILTYAGTSKKM